MLETISHVLTILVLGASVVYSGAKIFREVWRRVQRLSETRPALVKILFRVVACFILSIVPISIVSTLEQLHREIAELGDYISKVDDNLNRVRDLNLDTTRKEEVVDVLQARRNRLREETFASLFNMRERVGSIGELDATVFHQAMDKLWSRLSDPEW